MRTIIRLTVSLGVLTFLYIAFAVLIITKADNYQNCHDIFTCTAVNQSTRCDISIEMHGCDGTMPGGNHACLNAGCISSFNCACIVENGQRTGEAQSWVNCNNQVISSTKGCSGCPCRSEGQSCEAYNVCCPGQGLGCISGVCKRPTTIAECQGELVLEFHYQ